MTEDGFVPGRPFFNGLLAPRTHTSQTTPMHPLLRLIQGIDSLNRRIYSATCWLTLVMVLIGAFNALARYGDRFLPVRLSSNGWIELQWYFFSLVFLAAAPHALRLESHVRVDVFYGRLSIRGKAWIDLLGGLLFLLPFCIFAFYLAWPSAMQSFDIRETSPDPGGLSRWPIKLAVPIAFVLLTLQGVAEVLRRALFLAGKVTAKEAGLVPAEPEVDQVAPDPEATS
jgi:TRAP-type mannitol/chloroaromatic compound transport system permease small subunit